MPSTNLLAGEPDQVLPRPPEKLSQAKRLSPERAYPDINSETLLRIPTDQAAHYLLRRPQTLRIWAMRDGVGPIRPIRINGRLAWPLHDIKRLLGVSA